MRNNVSRGDLDTLIDHLKGDDPKLTHGPNVERFEQEWSSWLGKSRSVMVNSGSSANDLTLLALKYVHGTGEVIVSPLGWVSDIAAILHANCKPVFVDIDLDTLAPSAGAIENRVTNQTRAAILVHVLGLPALKPAHVEFFTSNPQVKLIEDVCEAHGAKVGTHRAGSIGWVSNFSFYYAHHLTTVEGGMVCTDDPKVYETVRMLRSHGLVREVSDGPTRNSIVSSHPDLNSEFIFEYFGHNMRPTEIQGILGLAQLARLDQNNLARTRNFTKFLNQLDNETFLTDFALEGSSNYAFILVLRDKDFEKRDKIEQVMRDNLIEFRRGLSGGGNQTRQPYLQREFPDLDPTKFPNAEHVHNFGWYIGNYPDLDPNDIDWLCEVLNS